MLFRSELNEIMKSYIRVMMDKSTIEKMSLDKELTNISRTSEQIQVKMQSTLGKHEEQQLNYAKQLATILQTGKQDIKASSELTIEELKNIHTTMDQKFSSIQIILDKQVNEVERQLKKRIIATEKRTEGLVAKTRKDVLVNNWLDAFKYGTAGAVMFMILRFIEGLM